MAAIYGRGKLCNCCHARENLWRLQYKRGKLCNCCHARQSLWWLQYKCRKLCNWCHARQKLWRLQAREYAADAKRGNTRKLPMQTYGLFQKWAARSSFDMFAQNCLDLGGCVLDILSHFLSTSSNCDWSDLGNLYTVLILKFGIKDFTDPGLLKIRLTLTSLSFWFCLQRCLWFPVLFLTCLNFTKVWHRTYPIWNTPLSRTAPRSFATLQKSRRNHRSCMWTVALSGMISVQAQKYSVNTALVYL